MSPLTFLEAAEVLRKRGVVLRQHPGFYSVNLRHGRTPTEYQTEELADAFAYGMTLEIAPQLAPLGPIGKGMTRRAFMYRHNRKIAARRARRAAKT